MPRAQAPAPAGPSMSPQQRNLAARQLLLRGGTVRGRHYPPAIDMWQPLNPQFQNSLAPGSQLAFYVRNVGLVKRLIVRISATVTADATDESDLTPLGLATLVSNVSFFHLGNNQRINSTGWH